MDSKSGLTNGLGQLTMTWPSPIKIDQKLNKDRKVISLLRSTDKSWASDSTTVQPDYNRYGKLGFPAADKRGSQLLAVSVEGKFDSYFKDKPSPLLDSEKSGSDKNKAGATANASASTSASNKKVKDTPAPITHLIDRSPESARIILFSSGSFLNDKMLGLASAAMGTQYTKPLQLVKNTVDWSLEDRGLLSIRGRSEFSRTLLPMDQSTRMFWEYLNYGLALFGLLIVWLIRTRINQHTKQRYAAILGTSA
jgi:ABC-2 type transport system permease protein